MKLIFLLSGGLDSATALAEFRGHERWALGVDYGQPHVIELEYARRIASDEEVPFEVLNVPAISKVNDVVFAARNAVLISVAASVAAARGLDGVVIGCNFTDWERFPDCRPAFVQSMGRAILDAYGVSLVAPFLRSTKAQVAKRARKLGVGKTWSCYAPRGDGPCGECLACNVLASSKVA